MSLFILIESRDGSVSIQTMKSVFQLIQLLTNARLPHQVSFDMPAVFPACSHVLILPGSHGFDAHQLIKLPLSDLAIAGFDPELGTGSETGLLQSAGAMDPVPFEVQSDSATALAPGFIPVSGFRPKTCICIRRDLLSKSLPSRGEIPSLAPTWLLDSRPTIQPYSARPKFSLGSQAWQRWVQTALPL